MHSRILVLWDASEPASLAGTSTDTVISDWTRNEIEIFKAFQGVTCRQNLINYRTPPSSACILDLRLLTQAKGANELEHLC